MNKLDLVFPTDLFLGRLLFIIYVNDFVHCSRNIHKMLFTDDTFVCAGEAYESACRDFEWATRKGKIFGLNATNYCQIPARSLIIFSNQAVKFAVINSLL